MARRCGEDYCIDFKRYTGYRGASFQPGLQSISAHALFVGSLGATPDGRTKQMLVSDGGVSPAQGRDICGPTAAMLSVAKLNHLEATNGALLIIAMAIIAFVQAKKYNWPVTAEKFSWKRVWHSFKHSILALLMPVIVLGGIYSGIFTATEAGAVSCVYALIVAVFIYKTLTWKEVLRIIRDSAVACSVILFIMGTSTVFSWLFTVSGISGWLVSSVTGAGLGYYPILLIITVILLIFGFFLEGIATVSMLLPLFIPIAQAVGIDLLHLGMIVTMTNVMGCMTPPVANNIFAASTFTGLPMGRISKGELPYLGCFFVVLLIVVFCPGLITMFG